MSLYFTFYEKLPRETDSVLPLSPGRSITFLNPYYLQKLKNRRILYEKFDYICSDGILPILLNRLWGMPKSTRCSFDMSSLARIVFDRLSSEGRGVYFLGSTIEVMEKFIGVMKRHYPNLSIEGSHHGYIKGKEMDVARDIIHSGAEVVVIGMGAPLQDEFALFLRECGFQGTIYTCGGFFHQTTQRLNYYPQWVDRWNLRAFYRLFHERYVLMRILRYYPQFIWGYSLFLLKLKKERLKR